MKLHEDFVPTLIDNERQYYKILSGDYKDIQISFDTVTIAEDENNEPILKYNFICSDEKLKDDRSFLNVVNEIFIEVLSNMNIDELLSSVYKEE